MSKDLQHKDFGEIIGGARKDWNKDWVAHIYQMNEKELEKYIKKDNLITVNQNAHPFIVAIQKELKLTLDQQPNFKYLSAQNDESLKFLVYSLYGNFCKTVNTFFNKNIHGLNDKVIDNFSNLKPILTHFFSTTENQSLFEDYFDLLSEDESLSLNYEEYKSYSFAKQSYLEKVYKRHQESLTFLLKDNPYYLYSFDFINKKDLGSSFYFALTKDVSSSLNVTKLIFKKLYKESFKNDVNIKEEEKTTLQNKLKEIYMSSDSEKVLNFIEEIFTNQTDVAKAFNMLCMQKYKGDLAFFYNEVKERNKDIDVHFLKDLNLDNLKNAKTDKKDIQLSSFNDFFKNIKTLIKDNETQQLYDHLKIIKRMGINWRKGQDVTGEDIIQKFNFRGGEFGNWISTDKERQAFLNLFYDAMMDLSFLLQIPPEKMGLFKNDTSLAIAFGSRGVAYSNAHFEPLRNVINLTRMRGAGSFAHEYGHAIDYFLNNQEFVVNDEKLINQSHPLLKQLIQKLTYLEEPSGQEIFSSNKRKMNHLLNKQLIQTYSYIPNMDYLSFIEKIEKIQKSFDDVFDFKGFIKEINKIETNQYSLSYNRIFNHFYNVCLDGVNDINDAFMAHVNIEAFKKLFKEFPLNQAQNSDLERLINKDNSKLNSISLTFCFYNLIFLYTKKELFLSNQDDFKQFNAKFSSSFINSQINDIARTLLQVNILKHFEILLHEDYSFKLPFALDKEKSFFKTHFALDANLLDFCSSKGNLGMTNVNKNNYYSLPTEMLARSMQTLVSVKNKEHHMFNQFLDNSVLTPCSLDFYFDFFNKKFGLKTHIFPTEEEFKKMDVMPIFNDIFSIISKNTPHPYSSIEDIEKDGYVLKDDVIFMKKVSEKEKASLLKSSQEDSKEENKTKTVKTVKTVQDVESADKHNLSTSSQNSNKNSSHSEGQEVIKAISNIKNEEENIDKVVAKNKEDKTTSSLSQETSETSETLVNNSNNTLKDKAQDKQEKGKLDTQKQLDILNKRIDNDLKKEQEKKNKFVQLDLFS